MSIEVKLLQKLIMEEIPDNEYMTDLATYCGIDEIWGCSDTGRVLYTNVEGGTEFTFKNEGQTAKFFTIFGKTDEIVADLPQKRIWDNKTFKYVGTGNYVGGIVQIGSIADLKGNRASEGFVNVAEDAKKIVKNVVEQSDIARDIVEKMNRVPARTLSRTSYQGKR